MMRRYCVLGASGFVGKRLSDRLERDGADVVRLSRPAFDLTQPGCFASFDFEGRHIVDCTANVDGPEEEARRATVDGLAALLAHLNGRGIDGFTYVSTTGVLHPHLVERSLYLRHKLDAEQLALALPWASILRLSFPFGTGENPKRLVTRLIRSALVGETLRVGLVSLPLTPVDCLAGHFAAVAAGGLRVLNFTDGKVYDLIDVVRTIFDALGFPHKFVLDQTVKEDLRLPEGPLHCFHADPLGLVRVMARTEQAASGTANAGTGLPP